MFISTSTVRQLFNLLYHLLFSVIDIQYNTHLHTFFFCLKGKLNSYKTVALYRVFDISTLWNYLKIISLKGFLKWKIIKEKSSKCYKYLKTLIV